MVRIGDRVTISQRAHLCGGSHDFRSEEMTLLKLPITVQNDAWVCADAFVGPGVTLGERSVVGACACVVRDVVEGEIVAGNPARVIGKR
jgi:putative colanic acid biosynthesis acetyltransferase WcaF